MGPNQMDEMNGAPPGDLGPIQVIDSTTATAQLVISPTASVGTRTIRVATTMIPRDEFETEILIDGFSVIFATPPVAASSHATTGLEDIDPSIRDASIRAQVASPSGSQRITSHHTCNITGQPPPERVSLRYAFTHKAPVRDRFRCALL